MRINSLKISPGGLCFNVCNFYMLKGARGWSIKSSVTYKVPWLHGVQAAWRISRLLARCIMLSHLISLFDKST